MSERLKVTIRTAEFTGRNSNRFSKLYIRKSLDELTHYFELESSVDATLFDDNGMQITLEHEEVKIYLNGQLVLTGWIDIVERIITPRRRYLQIKGRSQTRNLVDCPITLNENELTLKELAERAGSLTSTKISPDALSGDVVNEFAIQSEPAFDGLTFLARQQGLIMTTNSQGQLAITKIGEGSTSLLVVGESIEELKETRDGRKEYSCYTIKGGPDEEGMVTNQRIANQSRPFEAVNDREYTTASCQGLAEDEARKRVGESYTVKLTGWGHGEREENQWQEGERVHLSTGEAAEKFGLIPIDRLLIISTVELVMSPQGGRITTLTLKPKEAYI